MFYSYKFKRLLKLLVLVNPGQLIRPVHSETSSFLNGATVTMSTGRQGTSAILHLIDNSYKALCNSDNGIGPFSDYSFWFKIDLGIS